MSESLQHKLDRVRRPRVQITYDVETEGGMKQVELPFVVGVLADLSGHAAKSLPALRERKFVEVDRDNINEVMKKATPELQLRVPNRLSDDGSQLSVNLRFNSLEDFEPGRVAEEVAPLNELLQMRRRLDEVLSKMERNIKLEGLLQEVLANTDKVQALAKQMGIDTPATEEAK